MTNNWTRWINIFADTEIHEWRVRLCQSLVLCAIGFALPFVLRMFLGDA